MTPVTEAKFVGTPLAGDILKPSCRRLWVTEIDGCRSLWCLYNKEQLTVLRMSHMGEVRTDLPLLAQENRFYALLWNVLDA